jgi:hypothetical protein
MYRSASPRAVINSLVRERGGFRPRFSTVSRRRAHDWDPLTIESLLQSLESLFHGSFSGPAHEPIRIETTRDDPEALRVSLVNLSGYSDKAEAAAPEADAVLLPETPVLEVDRRGRRSELPLEFFMRGLFGTPPSTGNSRVIMITPSGYDRYSIGAMWDRAVESGNAPDVEEALRAIVPELERLYRLGESDSQGGAFYLELRGARRPIPIRNMGDGTNRVLGLTLALIRAAGGVLLIDEVENGLHYSVLVDVWRALLELAERLEVQVFATTHSWDCIRAFSEATNENNNVDGMLHRLETLGDGSIRMIDLHERDLELVAEQHIEVR